jgi:hypothetical protein
MNDRKQKKLDAARAAKTKAKQVLSQYGQVNGVGITERDGQYAVKVNLEKATVTGEDWPESIDGVPLVVQLIGKIRKQGG